jgi:crotonobetainyl-CoA:carnitine CoA-transferase CaiB-like acyl-CoA transferase
MLLADLGADVIKVHLLRPSCVEADRGARWKK